MTFGNDETYALIGAILQKSDERAYAPLLLIVYNDAETIINRYCHTIRAADKEDLLQEVVAQVWKSLPSFFLNSRQKTVAERNAWLREIVINKRNDLLRRLKRSVDANAEDYDDTIGSEYGNDYEKILETRDSFFDALKIVFQVHTTPDKLIAFVYSKLLYTLTGVNGTPKRVVEEFNGIQIDEMYRRMVADLSDVLQCGVPRSCLDPLKAKVEEHKSETFSLSARKIADSGNWITKKVKELRENEK